MPTPPQLAKLTALAAIREQAVAQPGPSPAGQALAAFSQLSATVLEAGGSLGSYKASTLARTLQRDRASSRADWIQGYMYSLGRRGLRVSNSPVSS